MPDIKQGFLDLGRADIDLLDGKLIERKKLSKIGNSYWLCIPKGWVELLCEFRDRHYWVAYELKGNVITIKAYKYKTRDEGA